MEFVSGCCWEKGAGRINRDSLALQQVLVRGKHVCIALICDGTGGGLQEGEKASGYASERLVAWFYEEFLRLYRKRSGKKRILNALTGVFSDINAGLYEYGQKRGRCLATTASVLLLTERGFWTVHAGNSRIYRIRGRWCRQLAGERSGNRRELEGCLGAGPVCVPDIVFHRRCRRTGFLICSDGFYRSWRAGELGRIFQLRFMRDKDSIERRLREAGERAFLKGEKDNLSAVYVAVREDTWEGRKVWGR